MPQIFHGYIAWPRTEPVRLSYSTKHIVATWNRQTVSTGAVRWRQVGTTAWHTSARYAGGSASIPAVAGRAYDVQMQIGWYDLTGPFGPTSRIAVPRVPAPAEPAHVKLFSQNLLAYFQ